MRLRSIVSDPGPASEHTRTLQAAAIEGLPFEDREDFEDARRGLIASAPGLVVQNAQGRDVWDMDSYAFVHAHEGATHEGATHEGATHEGATHRGATHGGAAHGVAAGAHGESHETRGEAPDTVHPSLWRMAQLNCAHGLFEVMPRHLSSARL
jgi:alkyl sulfatase BDS1-like metallo-beta-lactamase superfamily hydrolase